MHDAIAASVSWRGVLRELNLVATSAGAMRSVRSRADHLGLEYGHFAGQRRWNEEQLQSAVATETSWTEVVDALGLTGRSAVSIVKGHAARLELDVSHLTPIPADARPSPKLDLHRLGRAGALLAASWYTLSGHDVSWPLEPSRFDLIVHTVHGMRRVQVKTTTSRRSDKWQVYLSTTHGERTTYDPDEIDDFFIINADLECYLIPVEAVGGLHMIQLSAYEQYRVAGLVTISQTVPAATLT
ncbi:group I intron-associated PD-(D/E)XK endonuclease [Microbacterium invictum]|uniref:group I intron-associated PD-(D/E)XK endonuclease n=1 Tax=Microbacterium invictum TaxID=515415 RepID=UPI001887A493|nr:group I intron-associated PD-(D/E)XK endonuclease [Microbacterium invictum]